MDYNAPITQESFDEMLGCPNQADDRLELILSRGQAMDWLDLAVSERELLTPAADGALHVRRVFPPEGHLLLFP